MKIKQWLICYEFFPALQCRTYFIKSCFPPWNPPTFTSHFLHGPTWWLSVRSQVWCLEQPSGVVGMLLDISSDSGCETLGLWDDWSQVMNCSNCTESVYFQSIGPSGQWALVFGISGWQTIELSGPIFWTIGVLEWWAVRTMGSPKPSSARSRPSVLGAC